MIILKKVSELQIHGYIYTDGYSPRLVSMSNDNEMVYIISNDGKQVLENCEIEYLDKYSLCDNYHDEYYDEFLPCIMASKDEIIPLYEVMRL